MAIPPRRSRQPVSLAVGGVVMILLMLGIARVAGLMPSLGNPFTSRTVDRSEPALLQALEDLSQYRASSGYFQVVIDLEKDARFLPSFIRGERTLFTAAGTVDSIVDFSSLDEKAIRVSEDRRTVRLSLPAPTLSEARVDPERSRVVTRDRGLLDRLGSVFSDNPGSERELYLLAEDKMEAAARESDVLSRAEQNTREMLEAMMRSLGFTDVTVSFDAPAPPPRSGAA